jgi:hypothetical protein
MKRILILCLLLLVGCESHKPEPVPQWTASLIRPDGGVQQSWIVSSRVKPVVRVQWSGCVELWGHNGYEVAPLDLVAPVGWMWKCEEFR